MTAPGIYTTGPTSTLPGTTYPLPASEAGITCSSCPSPAELLLQGETDSFGSERNPVCRPCAARERSIVNLGDCEWCPTKNVPLHSARDYDEGSHGAVYEVCGPCVKKQNDSAQAELDAYEARYGDIDSQFR